MLYEEFGLSAGSILIISIIMYFVIKWAVKNGIKEAYKDMREEDSKSNEEITGENPKV